MDQDPISELQVLTTCPRDCYDGCGIVVSVADGAIQTVKGNREHPANLGPLCAKCATAYNGVWIDEDSRVTRPLRRIGPKGSGQFVEISWDEALEEVATRLQSIADSDGADSIYHTHDTGTCSLIAGSFPSRFFDHLGATEVDPDTICNNAAHVAWNYVFGSSTNGFDPRTAADSDCIVVWGANPSASAPHVEKHWLHSNGADVIVIDPVRHASAAAADMHLQLRPGSDAQLAFALAHVIQRDDLIDMSFVENHVQGYDEVATAIADCDPGWGERHTDIAAQVIEETAHRYAKGPSVLWLGQGLQRQPLGGNIFRAAAMLPALTGNIGKPGTGAYFLNSTLRIGARRGASPAHEPDTKAPAAPIVSQMDMPQKLNDENDVSAYVVWNCNPVASNPAQALTIQGLSREDLYTVVVDCFLTDTADYADIVLPAASFLEFDDLSASYFHLTIGPQVKCAEPMGESLPNQEIFRRLAQKMGFTEPHLFEEDQAIIDHALHDLGAGIDWPSLKARGWAYISDSPLQLWSDNSFATPSGKIEIASAAAREAGLPYTPQPIADPLPPTNHLRLLSPADSRLMNSSYGNDPLVRKRLGPATVTVHPDDAQVRGIVDGDVVDLANAGGELRLTALVSRDVPRGTVVVPKSRWPKFEPDRVNVNLLHIPKKTDMGESSSVHGVEVTLDRVEPSSSDLPKTRKQAQ